MRLFGKKCDYLGKNTIRYKSLFDLNTNKEINVQVNFSS
jgi:hypothetical protein